MNTALSGRMAVLGVLALVTALVLATAGTASAQPAVTQTVVDRFTETFTDQLPCQNEPYVLTTAVRTVTHITAAGEGEPGVVFDQLEGEFLLPLHFHIVRGEKIVAVPLDPTSDGPTYTGHYTVSENLNARGLTEEDNLIGTYTDVENLMLKGSDGSKVRDRIVTHYSTNARGDVTVWFEKPRLSC